MMWLISVNNSKEMNGGGPAGVKHIGNIASILLWLNCKETDKFIKQKIIRDTLKGLR